MQEETIKVTKCGECPFLVVDEEVEHFCNHDYVYSNSRRMLIIDDLREKHIYCPLKGKTIKIEIE